MERTQEIARTPVKSRIPIPTREAGHTGARASSSPPVTSPFQTPLASPSRIPVAIRSSPKHQVPTKMATPETNTSPHHFSPTSSTVSSQILSSIAPSPSETPKHSLPAAQLFASEKEGEEIYLPTSISTGPVASTPLYTVSTPTTASIQPMQHIRAPYLLPQQQQYTPGGGLASNTTQATQSILSDFGKYSSPQYMPSVIYNLPSDLESFYNQQHMNSDSTNGATSEHSTLTLSSLSIPSKVSVLSAGGGSATQVSSIHHTTPVMDGKSFNMPGQFSSLPEAKFQPQAIVDKDNIINKELRETKSMVEFLETENRLMQEKCSKFEVENASLQLKISQLEEQAKQMRQSHLEEHSKAMGSKEGEQAGLVEQLSQVMQEKQALANQLFSLQKEHNLCTQQMHIASTISSDNDKQLNTLRVELQEMQEKVRVLQDALRAAENEKDNLRRGYELDKTHLTEAESSCKTLKQNLDAATKKLEESRQKVFAKDELLSHKESELSIVQGELSMLRDNYRSLASNHESISLELQVLKQDLENKKRQLLENLQRKEAGDANIREVSEKLFILEREHKEKETTLENEIKERKRIETELTSLRRKNEKMSQQLALKDTAMKKQERDIANLMIEKERLQSQVSGRENELRNFQVSKEQDVSELKNLKSAMEVKMKALHDTIEEKEETIKSLTLQNKTLGCSVEYEKERNVSQNQEISRLKEELESFKQQCLALENEKHNLSLTATTKEKALTETESFMRKQVEGLEQENKSKEAKMHHTSVQLTQKEAELERTMGKVSDLQTQLVLLTADVENYKKLVESYKVKLQRLQDSKNQEIADMKQKMEEKTLEGVRLGSQVDSLQNELKEKEENLRKGQDSLQQEKKTTDELNAQLLATEIGNTSLRSHISQAEERLMKLEVGLAEKKTQLQGAEEKNHSLYTQLQNVSRSLQELQKASADERSYFTETLGSMSIQHRQEIAKMTTNEEILQAKYQETCDNFSRLQKQLELTKGDLRNAMESAKTKDIELKDLCASIDKEVSIRNDVTVKISHLQSQYDSLSNGKREVEGQLMHTSNELLQNQSKLANIQQHCSTLQQELQLQNEVHATAVKRMEEREKDSVEQSERKANEFMIKLEKSEERLQQVASELSRLQLDHKSLQSQLHHLTQTNESLQGQLSEKKSQLASDRQRLGQLERTFDQEKAAKAQTQETLKREMSRYQELKTKVEHLKDKLSQSASSKNSLEILLDEEKRTNSYYLEKIRDLENFQEALKASLQKEQDSSLADRQKAENDQLTLKKKYQSEKKILKDTLKGLQTEVQVLRSTIESHSKEITKLDKALNASEQEKDKLTDKKTELELQLKEKKEKLKMAETKIQNQEVQLAHLQSQVSQLNQSQLDIEEYKKAMEAKQRDELQRVLKEVTEHMEEQYTAHHYLEKLRADNETLAMKEKDRKIGHLKNELKAQRKELKKEKLQVESLSLEAKYLKAKQMEHERSQEKVGARLEKVNDLLSVSTGGGLGPSSPLSSSPIPMSTSTPLISRKSLQ